MGLISGRVVLAVIALCVLLGFSAAMGFVKFQSDPYKCVFGKHWENAGERQLLWNLGVLHFYYQPKYYGCPKEDQYDPHQYKNEFGQLTPLQTPGSLKQ